jgi:hypothetical protein
MIKELLQKGIRGVISQGRPSVNPHGYCMYRGTGDVKCAVGMLIPDETYRPSLEGRGVTTPQVADLLFATYKDLTEADLVLLVALQTCHDDAVARITDKNSKELILEDYVVEFKSYVSYMVHNNRLPEYCLEFLK